MDNDFRPCSFTHTHTHTLTHTYSHTHSLTHTHTNALARTRLLYTLCDIFTVSEIVSFGCLLYSGAFCTRVNTFMPQKPFKGT